ncbi:MAG TPA: hypothetical protein VJH63_00390 [Candidatus Paceibacterota bacterium]
MDEKDKNQQLEVLKYLSGKNQFVLYIFRKISRISKAIYTITDILKDTEPLKWKLRESVTNVFLLRNFFDEKNVFNNLEKILLELEALLDLSRVSVLSEMNVLIMFEEIRKLLTELHEKSSFGLYSGELSPSFFDVSKPTSSETLDYKSHKGHNVLYDFYNRHSANKSSFSANPKRANILHKGQRREEILKVIKDKGTVTIKDITLQIKNCSEKTVQRELTSMLILGVIKKSGERRWSKYSLI